MARQPKPQREHLIGLGHKRVGFITGSDEYALSADRLEGYRRAMRSAGLDDATLVGKGDFTFASGVEATPPSARAREPAYRDCRQQRPDGPGGARHCQANGACDVPRDLSIVSFDDTPIVKFSTPPLTAIRQPIAPMAARAAELLIAANSGEAGPATVQILPFELIVRGSTAAPGTLSTVSG